MGQYIWADHHRRQEGATIVSLPSIVELGKLTFVKLKTQRLSLVPMKGIDLEIFHKTNINDFVKRFLWDDQVIPKSLSAEIIKKVEKRFNEEQWGLWKIMNLKTGKYMGYVGLWYFFDEKQPQLLYALLPEYTGNGYATEASNEIIKYAFEVLKFDYLIAAMDKPNEESINVCKRLNMELVEEKEIEDKPTLFFRLNNKTTQDTAKNAM